VPTEAAVDLILPLFDADYYANAHPDQHGSARDMARHFHLHGWREGRWPSLSFDPAFYLETNPDVAAAGINPLLHYVQTGKAEARAILRPLADMVSPQDLDTVRPRFDAAFYRRTNPDVAGDDAALLVHFMAIGWRALRDPRPDFSTRHYLDTYPDIRAAGLNPFVHFIRHGQREGRQGRSDAPMWLAQSPEAQVTPPHLRSVVMGAQADPRARARDTPPDPAQLDLHWVIPDFRPGAGGHMTIFRMINLLERMGHRCTIWIETPATHASADAAWNTIVKSFQCVAARVAFVDDGFFDATGDAVIATGWTTAYLAHAATGFRKRFYFVQDHEVAFYPSGTERLLAEGSYGLDLNCICASPWLEQIMRDDYGLWARSFRLAHDRDIYSPADTSLPRAADARTRIAVYARDHTARRCVVLALMALEQLGRGRADFEVHFFGQDTLPFTAANFAAVNHGVLPPDRLAALYRDCDIGLCFSATNYSLVPQEMMGCGLPVVELDGASTRAVFPDGVVHLAGPAPGDIADKLAMLIDAPDRRAAQAARAHDWVAGFTWDGAADIVAAALRDRILADWPTDLASPAIAPASDIMMDVVIPTFDGMGQIEPVITALRTQRGADRLAIHCIDSSSTDGTTEWLRAQPDLRVTVIAQSDFQHGRTRNFGAAAGRAPLIAFLTQDAIPATADWAGDFARMFEHVPQAAGVFGRHLPYPHHPEWVHRDITDHFKRLGAHPLALSKYTDWDRWVSGDLGWRQTLHFYSDNNSAMRREIWADFPYPEIDYGEDQVWARDIIQAGHTKLYAPTARVFHSHDYGPDESYDRARIDGEFFYKYFGYEVGKGKDDEIDRRIQREQVAFKAWAQTRTIAPADRQRRLHSIAARHRGLRDGYRAARASLG
jgi:glycosyltransferase involved in cell wall biosynthesis